MKRLYLLLIIVLLGITVNGQLIPGVVASSQHSSSSGYDADLETYISGLSTSLSSGQLTLLNNMIAGWRSDFGGGLSTWADAIYILAGETSESSLRNAVKRDHDATNHSATFTALRGFTGDATSQYISTDFIPSTDGVNYTQNSASIIVYTRTAANPADESALTGWSNGTTQSYQHTYPSGEFIYEVNDGSLSYIETTSNAHAALWTASRTGSTTLTLYKNTSSYTPSTEASVGLPDSEMYILAEKYYTTPRYYSASEVSLVIFCRGLNSTEVGYIVSRFETYMDANGYGVIP